jgi:two-component system response regulator EvgA
MKPNKETYRILVIDDHPIVAEGIIALASQLEGVTCKGATCAKDVEQLTLKERFDLCTTGYEWIPTHIPPSQPDTRMRHFNLYHA